MSGWKHLGGLYPGHLCRCSYHIAVHECSRGIFSTPEAGCLLRLPRHCSCSRTRFTSCKVWGDWAVRVEVVCICLAVSWRTLLGIQWEEKAPEVVTVGYKWTSGRQAGGRALALSSQRQGRSELAARTSWLILWLAAAELVLQTLQQYLRMWVLLKEQPPELLG